ncbi:hypothetical protein IK146_01460 [Candidatus Saccharibacteria bacterium]|nr:hypothetical protein [Candidatus Saccharibacteria bacterium]
MKTIKTRLRRLYFRVKHDYLSFDNIIFFVAIIACFFWTYSSLSATAKNWELSQKLATRRREEKLLELEVASLKLENEYYRSAEYQELSARAKSNKMFDGEHLVYLPENSEAARKKYNETAKEETVSSGPSNVSQWMSFLFGT